MKKLKTNYEIKKIFAFCYLAGFRTAIIWTTNQKSVPDAPRFRFTYTEIDAKTVNASFEMASPQAPEVFKMYVEGKAFKVK